VPAPVIESVPTPEIATRTQAGAQPFVSAYLTEKVKTVLVVPVAGEAVPELRIGSCPWPEHAPLAALVAEPANRVAMIASESAKRRTMKNASWACRISPAAPYVALVPRYMHQKYAQVRASRRRRISARRGTRTVLSVTGPAATVAVHRSNSMHRGIRERKR
jgi:hypothetical protein